MAFAWFARESVEMETSCAASWLADIAEPLQSKFGGELTLCRAGNVVRWGFAGQYAVVEISADGRMSATFIDRAGIDAVSNRNAAAVYRRGFPYALSASGCSYMIADMVDFFSGIREPKFAFVDALVPTSRAVDALAG